MSCVVFIRLVTAAKAPDDANEADAACEPKSKRRCRRHVFHCHSLCPSPLSQVDPHRSHLTSSAVMLCEVPEDTEPERYADVAPHDKVLIGAWSDLRA